MMSLLTILNVILSSFLRNVEGLICLLRNDLIRRSFDELARDSVIEETRLRFKIGAFYNFLDTFSNQQKELFKDLTTVVQKYKVLDPANLYTVLPLCCPWDTHYINPDQFWRDCPFRLNIPLAFHRLNWIKHNIWNSLLITLIKQMNRGTFRAAWSMTYQTSYGPFISGAALHNWLLVSYNFITWQTKPNVHLLKSTCIQSYPTPVWPACFSLCPVQEQLLPTPLPTSGLF